MKTYQLYYHKPKPIFFAGQRFLQIAMAQSAPVIIGHMVLGIVWFQDTERVKSPVTQTQIDKIFLIMCRLLTVQ